MTMPANTTATWCDRCATDLPDEDSLTALWVGEFEGGRMVLVCTDCVAALHVDPVTRATIPASDVDGDPTWGRGRTLTRAQETRLRKLCQGYGVEFDAAHYRPSFELPDGYVSGWIGGPNAAGRTLYVGVDRDGNASS